MHPRIATNVAQLFCRRQLPIVLVKMLITPDKGCLCSSIYGSASICEEGKQFPLAGITQTAEKEGKHDQRWL